MLHKVCYDVSMGRPIENAERDEAIRILYAMGWGYARIGRLFGVSRQRVEQIVKLYNTEGGGVEC
jgi:hypothetical protein